MAKGNGTATQDANATGSESNADGTTEAPRKARSYIVVPMPPELKERFEAEAKAADQPVGPYVLRSVIAKQLGIDIPVTTIARRSKYASDDERKAAQKARNQSRSETMRALMANFKALQAKGVSAEDAVKQASELVASGGGAEASAPSEEAVPA